MDSKSCRDGQTREPPLHHSVDEFPRGERVHCCLDFLLDLVLYHLPMQNACLDLFHGHSIPLALLMTMRLTASA